jgi:hypothetical protein
MTLTLIVLGSLLLALSAFAIGVLEGKRIAAPDAAQRAHTDELELADRFRMEDGNNG